MDEMQKLETASVSQSMSDETQVEDLDKCNQEKKVDTVWLPLSTVYINGSDITISSYLDLTKKDYLWGIIVSDICLCKNCAQNISMGEVLRVANTPLVGNRRARIPNLSQMIEIFRYKEEFELTVKILKRHGVEADSFGDDWFWTFFTDNRLGLFKKDLPLKTYVRKCTGSLRCYFNVF